MKSGITRRAMVCGLPAAAAVRPSLASTSLERLGLRVFETQPPAPASSGAAPAADTTGAWEGFPRQHPGLVMQIVGAAHRDEPTVRLLLDRYPGLVHAAWDWGFGDWETALGAAAHTGRREIADLLLSRGARLDIFAATMLGRLDAVKAIISAVPGVERALGPHCITLMAHARAGGEQARAVADFLSSLPGADDGPKVKAIDDAVRTSLAGEYEYAASTSASASATAASPAPARFSVRAGENKLDLVVEGGGGGGGGNRRLHCLQDDEFFPAGVPSVRFRFERDAASGRAIGLTISDHDLRIVARRVG